MLKKCPIRNEAGRCSDRMSMNMCGRVIAKGKRRRFNCVQRFSWVQDKWFVPVEAR